MNTVLAPRALSWILVAALSPCAVSAAETAVPFTPAQIQALGVTTSAPQPVAQASQSAWSGRVVASPEGEWVVAAPSAGVLVRVTVTEGQRVSAGDVLAELASPELPSLAAEWQSAESAAQLAQREWMRDRQLHADGIIAARRAQATEQAAAKAAADLAAVRARLRLMGVDRADLHAGRLRLRAPAAGVIAERRGVAGQSLAAADTVFRLIDPARLNIELQVPVADADAFPVGTPLRVAEQTVIVRDVGPVASTDAQTVIVRAPLPGAAVSLRPGQWVPVQRVADAGTASAWRLPAAALIRHGDHSVVFARVPQGFAPIPVRVLSADAQQVIVAGALAPDSAVATQRTIALKGAWLGHGGE